MNNNDIFIIHPYLKSLKNKKLYYLRGKESSKSNKLKCKSSTIGLEKLSPKTYINTGKYIIFKKNNKRIIN